MKTESPNVQNALPARETVLGAGTEIAAAPEDCEIACPPELTQPPALEAR